jgi:hypothetical protein
VWDTAVKRKTWTLCYCWSRGWGKIKQCAADQVIKHYEGEPSRIKEHRGMGKEIALAYGIQIKYDSHPGISSLSTVNMGSYQWKAAWGS